MSAVLVIRASVPSKICASATASSSHRPGEAIRGQVGLEEARHFSLGHSPGEAAAGPAVGGATTLGCGPFVLGVQLAHHLLGHGFKLCDTRTAGLALFGSAQGIMGNDQPMTREGRLGQTLCIEGEVAEGFDQFAIAPRGHRENELKRAAAFLRQLRQGTDIVETEQPAVGDENDPLDGEALQNARQHGLKGLRLRDIAGMDGMHQGQTLGCLHDAHDELAGDAAGLFVHPVGADVVIDLSLAMDAYRRQIIEDNGEVTIHQRPDLLGKFALHPIGMVDQRVHGAQEMVVFHRLRHGRHRDRFQPAQHAKLTVRRAKPVEYHRPHEGFDIDLPLARAQRPSQGTVGAKVLADLVQSKDVAIGEASLLNQAIAESW